MYIKKSKTFSPKTPMNSFKKNALLLKALVSATSQFEEIE